MKLVSQPRKEATATAILDRRKNDPERKRNERCDKATWTPSTTNDADLDIRHELSHAT
jgi:hypothetical protein